MSGRILKDRMFQQFARIGQALCSPKRLELLDLLCQCEKDVETLALNAGMSVANTSHHLQVLRGAALVESRKEGVRVYYHLSNIGVGDLFRGLQQLAEQQLAEVERIVQKLSEDDGDLTPMDRKSLVKLANSGEILVLDVRPEDEYQASHIPFAVSMPISKLKNQLAQLPKHQQIVAYCRGPYCVLAGEAVRLLRQNGLHASRLHDGVVEWKQAGMELVVGQY